MKNALGRDVPAKLDERVLTPYAGAFATVPSGQKASRPQKMIKPGENKVLSSLKEAIEATGLANGMTISFHHSFRDGDLLVNQVVDACAKMGIKDLRLFPTALFPVHAPLIEHIKSGVVTRIEGSMNGPVGAFISQGGKLRRPVVLRSHGGRWRAVEAGDAKIDVAFIAASQADPYGNATGINGTTPVRSDHLLARRCSIRYEDRSGHQRPCSLSGPSV